MAEDRAKAEENVEELEKWARVRERGYAYPRVLLKLSGEALAGDVGYGIDPKVVDALADEIADIVEDEVEVAVVVGGGNTAAADVIYLARICRKVYLVHRRDKLRATAIYHERLRELGNVEFCWDSIAEEFIAGENGRVTGLKLRNVKTGDERVLAASAVFIAIGMRPYTAFLEGDLETDGGGYIVADAMGRTTMPGVFAAGDVRTKELRQVVTAVGDGAKAATALEKYAAAMQEKTGLRPQKPEIKETKSASGGEAQPEGVLPQQVMQQLEAVFERMQEPLILELYLDEKAISTELRSYMEELAQLTPKLTVRKSTDGAEHVPLVRVLRSDGSDSGLAFHGVPGGHEFTSFIMGLYNVAGPGQALDEETMDRIKALDAPTDMQIFVSLSCTMCPELVIAAQHIAALNPNVRAEAYDLNHFPALKETYNVMSVPCLVLNSEKVLFGKKSISQLLDTLEQQE